MKKPLYKIRYHMPDNPTSFWYIDTECGLSYEDAVRTANEYNSHNVATKAAVVLDTGDALPKWDLESCLFMVALCISSMSLAGIATWAVVTKLIIPIMQHFHFIP